MSTGCNASLGLAGAVHDCDWTEPHPGHAHHNHQAGATWTGATWRDLATLRAEVEALRYAALDPRYREMPMTPAVTGAREAWAYSTVLDLIDKHAREGQ